jgi:hypothetical protein
MTATPHGPLDGQVTTSTVSAPIQTLFLPSPFFSFCVGLFLLFLFPFLDLHRIIDI